MEILSASLFSFIWGVGAFITRNLRTDRVRSRQRLLNSTNRFWGKKLLWNFCFKWKLSWLYAVPDAHVNSRGHTSSLPPTRCTPHFYEVTYENCRSHTCRLLPTQYKWSCFFLACHPCNVCVISTENTCVLITLGTRCIHSYVFSPCPTFTRQMLFQVSI